MESRLIARRIYLSIYSSDWNEEMLAKSLDFVKPRAARYGSHERHSREHDNGKLRSGRHSTLSVLQYNRVAYQSLDRGRD